MECKLLVLATCCWLLVIARVAETSDLPTFVLNTDDGINGSILTITEETGLVGIIISPNYPEPSQEGVTAGATLRAMDPNITKIGLKFLDLDLEYSARCWNEYVHFSLPSLKFCGDIIPAPYLTDSRKLYIELKTDDFNSFGRGCKLQYEFHYDDIPTCGSNEYQCRNGRCVELQLKCNYIDDCGDASDEDLSAMCEISHTLPYLSDFECGLTHTEPKNTRHFDIGAQGQGPASLESRIVGGDYAHPGSWPSMVNLELNYSVPSDHTCGATLIHPMFAISAAHCISGQAVDSIKLVFGQHDILPPRPMPVRTQTRYAADVHMYPSYWETRGGRIQHAYDPYHDIVLIRFNAPVQLSRKVWPACLPYVNEPIDAGRRCYVTGWGRTKGSGSSMSILRQAIQRITHKDDCRPSFTSKISSTRHIYDNSEICVTNVDGGSNLGDNGGPLYCKNIVNIKTNNQQENRSGKIMSAANYTNRWIVHGVGSRFHGTLPISHAGARIQQMIFARVSTKVEWILSCMDKYLQFDSEEGGYFNQLSRNRGEHLSPMTIMNN